MANEVGLEAGRWAASAGELTDEMLLLKEAEAVEAFFDETNLRRLHTWLWLLAVIGLLGTLVAGLSRSPFEAALWGLPALVDLLLLRAFKSPLLRRHVRLVAAAVLVGHLFVHSLHLDLDSNAAGAMFILAAILAVRLRLAIGELVALLGALYAVLAARIVVVQAVISRQGIPVGQLIATAVGLLVLFSLGALTTLRQRSRFVLRWRAEASRHHERLRMKQELEYARSIQLSMLPRSAPAFDWLDIAALSLPATEVGGDYYDYFHLGPERLVVAVGDVTGHGVASGLVLSGVRSSLNLLQEELAEPARVLGRVNRMLKRISTPRMLMTLVLAILDRRDRSLTVATAAHPPLLRRAGSDGRLEEVGRGSLPLGAIAETAYVEDRVPLEPGDTLLLYSDGLVEAVDPGGAQYGWERLRGAFEQARALGTAREVRDSLLRDVWEFKGKADQVDDVTMVVVRVLG